MKPRQPRTQSISTPSASVSHPLPLSDSPSLALQTYLSSEDNEENLISDNYTNAATFLLQHPVTTVEKQATNLQLENSETELEDYETEEDQSIPKGIRCL